MNKKLNIELTLVLCLGAYSLSFASDLRKPTDNEAAAVYCAESDRLALIQLQSFYSRVPDSIKISSTVHEQLEKHKARLDNVNAFIHPRLAQFEPKYVATIRSTAKGDFKIAAQEFAACIASKSCTTTSSEVENRVQACLHRSW